MVRIEAETTRESGEFFPKSTKATKKQMLESLITECCYLRKQEGIAHQIGLLEACKRKWHGITTLQQLKSYNPPDALSLTEVAHIVCRIHDASRNEKSAAKRLELKIKLMQEVNEFFKTMLEKKLNNSFAIAFQNDKKNIKEISSTVAMGSLCVAGALLVGAFFATYEVVCFKWKK